jgi:hypothetical protein
MKLAPIMAATVITSLCQKGMSPAPAFLHFAASLYHLGEGHAKVWAERLARRAAVKRPRSESD